MNKIYGIIVIFAFAGLMIPTSAMQVEAASDLDYMLIIAEKGKKYIKLKINEMQNSNLQDWKNQQVVLDIYDKSAYEIEQLEKAIENGDVKSARKLFVSSMGNLKQISLMLNQIAVNKAQDEALPDYPQILKRYEMNIQKLKQMSQKLDADIDFSEIENDIFERVSEQVCSYYEVDHIEDLTEEQISEVQQWALDDLGSSSVIQIGITDLINYWENITQNDVEAENDNHIQ